MDQIAAQHIGQDTPLPSLELATEDAHGNGGACDREYGCSYANTISFRTPTTPLPMEYNPRKVFERLFGTRRHAPKSGTQRSEESGSILDAVTQDADSLRASAGRRKTSPGSAITWRACARSSAACRKCARQRQRRPEAARNPRRHA